MDTGSPRPALYLADAGALHCAYYTGQKDQLSEGTAVLRFDRAIFFRFGWPNDEVLTAHELYPYGLGFYGFFLVENSPLIHGLAKRNSIHPRHYPPSWDKRRHYVITFHDETLEVISDEATVVKEGNLPADQVVTQNYRGNSEFSEEQFTSRCAARRKP
jgi:hypothetical protein